MRRICVLLCATLIMLVTSASLHAEKEMQSIKLKNKTLDFKLTIPPRCMFGDFDLVGRDLSHSDNPRLIASATLLGTGDSTYVEILKSYVKGKRVKVQKPEKSTGEAPEPPKAEDQQAARKLRHSGEDFSFPASFFKKAGVYLIQVCKDSEGTNTCADKKYREFSDMFAEYEKEDDDPEHYFNAKDNLYYQTVLVSDGGGELAYADFVIDTTSLDELAEFIEEKSLLTKDVQSKLANVAKMMSFNLENDSASGQLSLPLPEFNPHKCGQNL